MHHTAWTAREGAPTAAWAIAQTADGALWVGDDRGLFRFDGVRFERFMTPGDDGKLLVDVVSLHADGGDLWIGLNSGRGIYRLGPDGVPRIQGPAAGIDRRLVAIGFASDGAGGLWAATSHGPFRLTDGRWRAVADELGHPVIQMASIFRDSQGGIWTTGVQGVFHLPPGGSRFRLIDNGSTGGFLSESSDHTVWFSGTSQTMYAASRVAANPSAPRTGLHNEKGIGAPLVDRDDSVWFFATGGVFRLPSQRDIGRLRPDNFPANVQRFGRDHGLSGEWPHRSFEDRDGNVWITTNGGIDRFRAAAVVRHPNEDIGYSGFVAAPDAGLVLVNQRVGLTFVDKDEAKPNRDVAVPQATFVREEPGGVRWVGSYIGLWRADGDGHHPVRVPLPAEVGTSAIVWNILRHHDDAL